MSTGNPFAKARLAAGAVLLAAAAGCSDTLTSPLAGLPDSIEVVQGQVLMESLGQTVELVARVKDRNGREVPGAQVVWEVESPSVVALEGPNRLRSLSNGETRVWVRLADPTASVEGAGYNSGRLRREVPVRVLQRLAGVQINAPAGVIDLWAIGETVDLEAVGIDAGGTPMALPQPVIWSSANAGLAEVGVASGRVEALREGQAVIRAEIGSARAEVLVRIQPLMSFQGCVSSGPMRFRDAAAVRSRCDSDQKLVYHSTEAAALETSEGGEK